VGSPSRSQVADCVPWGSQWLCLRVRGARR
jgi:hypothetical protein